MGDMADSIIWAYGEDLSMGEHADWEIEKLTEPRYGFYEQYLGHGQSRASRMTLSRAKAHRWTTADGRQNKLDSFDTRHLENIKRLLERRQLNFTPEYEAVKMVLESRKEVDKKTSQGYYPDEL